MSKCVQCSCHTPLEFAVRMAFQPIVNVATQQVFAYEALVRGQNGEGAGQVISQVTADNLYSFDQTCRVRAIETAAQIKLPAKLSINFMPNAIYEPETCLAKTLQTAQKVNFPHQDIIFEVTEHEKVENHDLLVDVFRTYQRRGFMTAIDDFGEGYAGLNLLADFQPDLLKLDMKMIRNIHVDRVKQAIFNGIHRVAQDLGIVLIAEGVETLEEYAFFKHAGVDLQQGYFFARPALEHAPIPDWQ
ncbi:EAL domain-containing protein [Aliidiomarina maris]|uniref:Diguanylate phosphodiesterase n=2 Tax=Aliidiomarina maris TaxID=531312 RepID=A0A327X5L9_9GAMM|nr:EAL domain-containing protein [Aliidiomarina maris]RAK00644.1 EAL domain-containing protein (putative c-di-GMP-specific phosphodiesterase class I) [Aliidiomarina maris]RUO27346.1 diguanylate phosphodiesterase [Aliidiomarina maris]